MPNESMNFDAKAINILRKEEKAKMYGTIDLFKEFHRNAIQQEFPPSARVLFDTVLFLSEISDGADSLVLSERDLVHITGLKKTTLHDAKHFLTSRHLLECKKTKKGQLYKIPKENLPTTSAAKPRALADHFGLFPNVITTPGSSHNVITTLGSSQEVSKDEEDEKKYYLSSSCTQSIHPYINPSMDGMDGWIEKKDGREQHVDEIEEIDELVEYWEEKLHGGRLSFEHMSRLKVWIEKKGKEWVREGMRYASDVNTNPRGLSIKFLFGVLKRKDKGDEENDERGETGIDARATWRDDEE